MSGSIGAVACEAPSGRSSTTPSRVRHRCPVDDPGIAQGLLRNPHPAAAPDHDGGALAAPLLADAAVADVDHAVGDRGRAGVVADDERSDAFLARELGEERVDGCGAELVELARRLVGDQEPRPVGERRAERDALLLAARQLTGVRVRAVAQADALEELVRPGEALLLRNAPAGRAGQRRAARRSARRQARASSAGRRTRASSPGSRRGAAARAMPSCRPATAMRAGARPLESGQDPHQRRLARSARAEDDADLALLDVERQAL